MSACIGGARAMCHAEACAGPMEPPATSTVLHSMTARASTIPAGLARMGHGSRGNECGLRDVQCYTFWSALCSVLRALRMRRAQVVLPHHLPKYLLTLDMSSLAPVHDTALGSRARRWMNGSSRLPPLMLYQASPIDAACRLRFERILLVQGRCYSSTFRERHVQWKSKHINWQRATQRIHS
jgi:hypothetical protein